MLNWQHTQYICVNLHILTLKYTLDIPNYGNHRSVQTWLINVLHIIRKWEALALVKCKRAGNPGLCWVSWLCTTSASESQWRALCSCGVGAWGWEKFKATASQGFLQSQTSRNACQQGLMSYVPFPSPSALDKGMRDKNVLWLLLLSCSHSTAQQRCTGDTAAEAMKMQMSTWSIKKLKQASPCCTRNLLWKHFWEWHLIFIKRENNFYSVGQSKPWQKKGFIQFLSIVFVWQCYPKQTASLALHFLKWEPERLLAVHVLDYFYF